MFVVFMFRSQPDAPDIPVWSKPPALPPSSTSISRSNSSARTQPKGSVYTNYSSFSMLEMYLPLYPINDLNNVCLYIQHVLLFELDFSVLNSYDA